MSQVTGVKITKLEVKGLGAVLAPQTAFPGTGAWFRRETPQSWIRHTHIHSFPIGIAFLEMEALFLIFTVR